MAEETTQNIVKTDSLVCPITWDNLKSLVQDDVDLRFPYITKKYKNYYMYQ